MLSFDSSCCESLQCFHDPCDGLACVLNYWWNERLWEFDRSIMWNLKVLSMRPQSIQECDPLSSLRLSYCWYSALMLLPESSHCLPGTYKEFSWEAVMLKNTMLCFFLSRAVDACRSCFPWARGSIPWLPHKDSIHKHLSAAPTFLKKL